MGIRDKFTRAVGKDDPQTTFQLRLKKSTRSAWDRIAEEKGFESTSGLIKFIMKKAEDEPEKIFG